MSEEGTPVEETPKKKGARKSEQPTQNGVTRPKPDTVTGRVWDICDELSKKAKAPAVRSDVMKACEEEGINKATVATQYGKWRKFNGLKRAAKAPNPAIPADAK